MDACKWVGGLIAFWSHFLALQITAGSVDENMAVATQVCHAMNEGLDVAGALQLKQSLLQTVVHSVDID